MKLKNYMLSFGQDLWGTFIAQGGSKIARNYQFQFINDDGTFKAQ